MILAFLQHLKDFSQNPAPQPRPYQSRLLILA
jgi:hypothetical protein